MRIIDAAEKLFAERTFHGVSLRAITDQARANLAAVNYHFGDKRNLYRETLLRRLRLLNASRFSLLEEACRQSGSAPPPLSDIISILASPLFDLHRSEIGGRYFVQILSTALTESSDLTASLLAEEYHPALSRFGQLIRRHVPQMPPEEFLWRFSFVIGSLHHTLATLHQMAALTRGICRANDHDAALTRFVAHGVTSFETPARSISSSRHL